MKNVSDLGLIKTKYSMPVPGKRLIPRHALNKKLDDSRQLKLTVITAPAGYGKTSAVLKWLENETLPRAWLSIDAGDNDAFVFWRYFCAALDAVSNGISRDTEYVFASQELFQANVHLTILIDRLSSVPSDFFLVLDDFHLITSRNVIDGLYYFITYLPANMHIILLSRAEPRLNLEKLGISEDLERIRARNLRFDTEEISRYYETRGYDLKEDEIQRIESYTEGWAAALVAVALSLKDEAARHTVISGFGSCARRIESYLSEDVFNTWTKEQQDFMMKTSALDQLCGPLCEAVAGTGGDKLLKDLYDQNSFLVALDGEGVWFRYHHLFLDFLRKRENNVGEVQKLHRRAGNWLEANGYFDEAIEHYFAGDCYDDVLLLLEKLATKLIRQGEYRKAAAWVEKLPDSYIQNAPRLIMIKILYYTFAGNYKKAWTFMRDIERILKESAGFPELVEKNYYLLKTNLMIVQGNMDEALQAIRKTAAGTDCADEPYMDFNLFDISIYRGPYRTFIKALNEKPGVYEEICAGYRRFTVLHPGYYYLIKGEACYERGYQGEAVPYLVDAIGEAKQAGSPGAMVPAVITLAKIRRARGDVKGAMEILLECERWLSMVHKPHWEYKLRAFKVYFYYIPMGDTEWIGSWMKESRLDIYQEITGACEYELIVLARALLFMRRYDTAEMLLNRLWSFARVNNRAHSLVEILNLLAITAMKNLDEELALEFFENALSIGMAENYMNIFADELNPMAALLEAYIRKHAGGDKPAAYAIKLNSLTRDRCIHAVFSPDPGALDSLLTSTERKVLRMITNACTNQEIAAELNITLRTVKAHTGRIYEKLGVKNRVQCLKKVKP